VTCLDGLIFAKFVAYRHRNDGLNPHRDRLCLGPTCPQAMEIRIWCRSKKGQADAPNLCKMAGRDPVVVKTVFTFAPLRCAGLLMPWRCAAPVYCTKIGLQADRTYTDRHGLEGAVFKEACCIEFPSTSNPVTEGASDLSEAQLCYAASDVFICIKARPL